MVRTGEQFFSSLGFEPLPETFWERSQFTKPRTARSCAMPARGTWTMSTICASRCASRSNADDFITIHHELGHNYYQRAYNQQDFCISTAPTTGSTRPSAT